MLLTLPPLPPDIGRRERCRHQPGPPIEAAGRRHLRAHDAARAAGGGRRGRSRRRPQGIRARARRDHQDMMGGGGGRRGCYG